MVESSLINLLTTINSYTQRDQAQENAINNKPIFSLTFAERVDR